MNQTVISEWNETNDLAKANETLENKSWWFSFMGFELYSFAKSIEILFEFNSIGPFHEIFLTSTRLNDDKLMKFSNSIRLNWWIVNTFFQRNSTELGNSKKVLSTQLNSIQVNNWIELPSSVFMMMLSIQY
jgi:hypothetical protein